MSNIRTAGTKESLLLFVFRKKLIDAGRTTPTRDAEGHVIEVTETNSDRCSPEGRVHGHESTHQHGPDCGHEAVPHGDHIDYLVNGRLHHPHGDHCDDHGPLSVVSH